MTNISDTFIRLLYLHSIQIYHKRFIISSDSYNLREKSIWGLLSFVKKRMQSNSYSLLGCLRIATQKSKLMLITCVFYIARFRKKWRDWTTNNKGYTYIYLFRWLVNDTGLSLKRLNASCAAVELSFLMVELCNTELKPK